MEMEKIAERAYRDALDLFKLSNAGFFGNLGNAVQKGVAGFKASGKAGNGIMHNVDNAIHGFQAAGGNKVVGQAAVGGLAGYGAYRALGGGEQRR